MVEEAASMKWQDDNLKIVDNILDITPFKPAIIIGTLFKDQKLKPSILNDIMGVIGQKHYEDAETGDFIYGNFVSKDSEKNDVAVLEDKSGRITIRNSDKFDINHFVSGSVVALKGQAIDGGYFQVDDYCFAGMPY